ncbi:MAG TPA: recombinase family protein [Candidatus Saccharimonadales bacterium]
MPDGSSVHETTVFYTFTDKISTRKDSGEREGLEKAMSLLRKGDTLVVWRLDRLGRTLRELIDLVNGLGDKGIGFKSLTESIDTTTPNGKLVFHIFGALAEFERDLIKERTTAGLAAARARGRKGGRPKAITDPKKLACLYALYDSKEVEISELLTMFDISRGTLYKYLEKRRAEVCAGLDITITFY